MIPNIHQSVDEIIKSATPAQRVIWQQIRLITGENAGIKQHYYCGINTVVDMSSYDAHILYYALSICGSFASTPVAVFPVNRFYNENNVLSLDVTIVEPFWNVTAAQIQYHLAYFNLENVLFSRIVTDWTYFKFIGFKISY